MTVLQSTDSPKLITAKKLAYLETDLIDNMSFVVHNRFTIADVYLYIVQAWTQYVGIDLAPYPLTKAFFEGMRALDNVQRAHARTATESVTTY